MSHIVVNGLLAYPAARYFGWHGTEISILMFSTIAIDFDHVVYLSLRNNTYKPKSLLSIGKKYRDGMIPGLYFFHSPEFLAFLVVMSFKYRFAATILLSFTVHILMDIIEHYRFHRNFKWIFAWSPIYTILGQKHEYRLR